MPIANKDITEEELQEFREIFDLVDEDKSGEISKDELKKLMITLGLKPTDEQIDAMMKEVDEDESGDIDFSEFVKGERQCAVVIEGLEKRRDNFLSFPFLFISCSHVEEDPSGLQPTTNQSGFQNIRQERYWVREGRCTGACSHHVWQQSHLSGGSHGPHQCSRSGQYGSY